MGAVKALDETPAKVHFNEMQPATSHRA
ncbi:MAG: hypothetical protein ACI91J_001097 [Yoonia sp.]